MHHISYDNHNSPSTKPMTLFAEIQGKLLEYQRKSVRDEWIVKLRLIYILRN